MILSSLNFIERRTGNVDVTTFYQGLLITVEECEQQGADVGAIYIGIGHDYNAMIAQIFYVKIFTLDAQA